MRVLLRLVVLISGLTVAAAASADQKKDLENMLYLELKTGRVVIQLLPEVAPKHVARIKELARQKFYDGIIFHRVIPGFMAQTGDPTGTGTGGSGQKLPAEFSQTPFERGTIGAARTADPDSADSQFFICFAPAPHLNGQYTVWGKVIEGMDLVDQIAAGEPPANPDKIITLRVAADVEAQKQDGWRVANRSGSLRRRSRRRCPATCRATPSTASARRSRARRRRSCGTTPSGCPPSPPSSNTSTSPTRAIRR
jgi:cyclophilin family peptidyl-prolyl cis-trans isomerase